MGEYCNYHLAQGVEDHSKIAYKGLVVVEPVKGWKPKCNGVQTDKKQCTRDAVWTTTCFMTNDHMIWVGQPDPDYKSPQVGAE